MIRRTRGSVEISPHFTIALVRFAFTPVTKGALEVFQKGLSLRQQLMNENPADAALTREVAVSHMKIGEASQKLGDVKTALDQERQARTGWVPVKTLRAR